MMLLMKKILTLLLILKVSLGWHATSNDFFFWIEVLSPIETPTDIIQRPALRRILQSGHINALAGTAMEFIEGEKDFNKVLCRLSAILHKDDPQYLDVDLDDTPSSTQTDTIDEPTTDAKDGNDTTATTTSENEVVRHVKELLLVICTHKSSTGLTDSLSRKTSISVMSTWQDYRGRVTNWRRPGCRRKHFTRNCNHNWLLNDDLPAGIRNL